MDGWIGRKDQLIDLSDVRAADKAERQDQTAGRARIQPSSWALVFLVRCSCQRFC